MTNREKYSEEIMEILFKTGIHPALINEQIAECHKECRHCKFAHTKYSCDEAFIHWVESPCEPGKIDWNKVPVDTKFSKRFYEWSLDQSSLCCSTRQSCNCF